MSKAEIARVIAGKYELEKLLGQGGMGEVWVATERSTGRKLAVKLLNSAAADSKESRARFEREARIAKTLVSPHIAQVTDSGVDENDNPFMALELLHGEDLQKRIKTEKALPASQVMTVAIQVGRALHVAHSAGLVHRDLKPANIFLARQGGEEIVKVLDFGIAKTGAMDNTQYTAAGAMLGTAAYMSPEQIRNAKSVDHRADLWAFAVVLFRALTGELPFELQGFDLFLALAQDPIPTPLKVTSLAPHLPMPLNVFFERAFSQDIKQRYPTASAMVVGFCRASGVTVPADVLTAADAPMPSPISASPLSLGRSGAVPVAPAAPPPPPVAEEPSHGLAGTMMMDVAPPDPRRTGSHPNIQVPSLAAVPPGMELDPDEPDNAATLFYQPPPKSLPNAPAAPPPAPPPPAPPLASVEIAPHLNVGFPRDPAQAPVLTYPLEAARAAAAEPVVAPARTAQIAPAARAARTARIWALVMIGVIVALAVGGLIILFVAKP